MKTGKLKAVEQLVLINSIMRNFGSYVSLSALNFSMYSFLVVKPSKQYNQRISVRPFSCAYRRLQSSFMAVIKQVHDCYNLRLV